MLLQLSEKLVIINEDEWMLMVVTEMSQGHSVRRVPRALARRRPGSCLGPRFGRANRGERARAILCPGATHLQASSSAFLGSVLQPHIRGEVLVIKAAIAFNNLNDLDVSATKPPKRRTAGGGLALVIGGVCAALVDKGLVMQSPIRP